MSFWQWSKTAGSNATADSSINWAEGQSPSSINDSARAMMARLAEYRDDSSGLLTTGGILTAYTLISNQGLSATPNNGQLIAFTPNVTNGLGVTLAVDGGTAYQIQISPGTNVGASVLIQGTPYTVTFNSSQPAWILGSSFANAFNIPIGGMIPYLASTAPSSNFVMPMGQAISRTTYATLFGLVGTTFGTGDGVTTFNVIDLSNRIPICWNNGTGSTRVNTAITGTLIGSAGGSEVFTLNQSALPNVQLSVTITDSATGTSQQNGVTGVSGVGNSYLGSSAGGGTTHTLTGTANLNGNQAQTATNRMPPAIIVPFILRVI